MIKGGAWLVRHAVGVSIFGTCMYIRTDGVDECYMVNDVTFAQVQNYFAIRRRFFENVKIQHHCYRCSMD